MIELQNITINTLDKDSMGINWEVVPTIENLNEYTLDIYRAEAPGNISEFELVSSGIESIVGTYLDNSLDKMSYSMNRKIYYYLQARDAISLNTKNFGPYVMETAPDLQALEIIRRKNIVLNNSRYGARTFKILKKRTWGNYCPTCFDPVTQRTQDINCPVCHGTGIEGGYFDPLEIKGYRSDRSFRAQLNLFGKFEESDVAFVLGNTPLLVPNDYLIDEQNIRYLILAPVQHVEKGLYILSQNIRAQVISPSAPIYEITL